MTVPPAPEPTRTGPLARAPLSVELDAQGRVAAIGPYRVEGLLGKGGMGIVYRVVDTRIDQPRALKTIEARFLARSDSQADRRFDQEIDVLDQLDHRGIVRMFDHGWADHPMGYELAYFVMEELKGESLDRPMARNEDFSIPRCLHLLTEVTDALAYLDRSGVRHRDIKPANLFLEKDGRIVLMDFGLARSQELTRLTAAGHIIGTMAYMPPEALRAHDTDIRGDVYALGVVQYELLCGRYPFQAQDPTRLVDEIRAGVRWPTPPADADMQKIRPLIERMLAFKPQDRPAPAELTDAARRLAQATAPAAFDPRSPDASENLPASAAVPPPVIAAPPRTGPRWAATFGIASVCSALAFGAGIAVGRGTVPPPPPPRAEPPPPVVPVPVPVPSPPVAEPMPDFASAQAAYRYGESALEDGQLQRAIDALLRALEINPAYATAYRKLGDAHLSAGRIDQALAYYKKYIALRPNAPDATEVKSLIQDVER